MPSSSLPSSPPSSPSSSSPLSFPSSSSSPDWQYHVFPSFHGADVRKTFLSHVFVVFRSKGIELFTDSDIVRAKSISPALTEAIRGSRIALVMLSRNYASSSWCLDELVEIMKCWKELGQEVVIVFYELDPRDVKKQTGDFGKLFRKTCKGKTKEDIERWKQALATVAVIAGYHSNNWDNEAALIQRISIDISNKLNNFTPASHFEEGLDSDEDDTDEESTTDNSAPPSDYDDLVGMEAHMEKMEQLLRLHSADEVRMIGISGPIGIGKTTIAKCIYEQVSPRFQFSTIMANIKECYASNCHDEHNAKLQLQNQLLSQLSNQGTDEIFHLGVAQEMLKDKKVLVVLDDVDGFRQLDALKEKTRCFGPGSVIIITTQDPRLLKGYGIEHIHKVDFPSPDQALQILSMYAFGQKSPHDGFANLAQEVTTLSGKLPLGLRLMGSYLQGKSEQEWTNELPRLRTSLDGEMGSILKFTYESLSVEDRRVSHRIAASFSNGDCNETVTESFSNVRQELIISNQVFNEDTYTSDRASEGISNGVIHWEQCQITCWPSTLYLEGIDELYMPYSNLEKLEGIRPLRKFRVMNFSSSKNLKQLPDLSTATSLQELCLRCCSNLVELPSSIGNATNLLILNLEYCSSLVYLPLSIGNATKLKNLCLTGCSSLVGLPYTIGNFTNLEKLNLEFCSSLVKLPSTIGDAINLKELYLTGCSSLVELPGSIGNATSLEILDLSNCSSLMELPSSIGDVKSLHYLYLSNCSSLVELPNSIGNATNLWELVMNNCSSLVGLPSSIGNASHLRKLDLSNCSSLVELPFTIGYATKLQYLHLSNCSSLVNLPASIGYATSLEHLYLNNCSNLREVPSSLGNAVNLKKLDLSWCTSLVKLPDSIRNSTSLWQLDLDNCSSLLEVPSSTGNGVRLKKLDLSW